MATTGLIAVAMATAALVAVIVTAVAALIGALVALLSFFYGIGKDVERRD